MTGYSPPSEIILNLSIYRLEADRETGGHPEGRIRTDRGTHGRIRRPSFRIVYPGIGRKMALRENSVGRDHITCNSDTRSRWQTPSPLDAPNDYPSSRSSVPSRTRPCTHGTRLTPPLYSQIRLTYDGDLRIIRNTGGDGGGILVRCRRHRSMTSLEYT